MLRLHKGKAVEAWGRISVWASLHRPLARLIYTSAGLAVFLAILPSYLRIFFWDGLKSNKILASLLLIFSLLAISLVWSTGQVFDSWVFLLFNLRGKRPIWLDRVMSGFTQIGSGIAAMGIALVFFIAGNRLLAYELVLGSITLWLVVELLKLLVHRSRPFIKLTQARVVGYRAIGRSFPSGHTSQAFFLAMMIVQHFHANIWVVVLLFTTAILVGITRMYVGAHYPRDVLAGAILGSGWGLLGVIVFGYVFNGFG
jgi:membrane-associated phospholipid phosphatase